MLAIDSMNLSRMLYSLDTGTASFFLFCLLFLFLHLSLSFKPKQSIYFFQLQQKFSYYDISTQRCMNAKLVT